MSTLTKEVEIESQNHSNVCGNTYSNTVSAWWSDDIAVEYQYNNYRVYIYNLLKFNNNYILYIQCKLRV